MLARAKVTSKGQLTLPADLRAHLKLEAGDHVEFDIRDDGSVLMRAVNLPIEALFGCIKYEGPSLTIEQINEGIRLAAVEGEEPSRREKRRKRQDRAA